MGIEMKACSKCKTVKALTEFRKQTGRKHGVRSECKVCAAASLAKYRANNPERHLASLAKYRANNREKLSDGNAKYRANNREKYLAGQAKRYADGKNTLSDSHVKNSLKLGGIKIPQELIELKRIQILIKRELRK